MQWKEGQLEKINELYDHNIDASFNSSSPFYLDVCYKYTTPSKEDMFLEDRKKYYINEPLCESDCKFVKYEKDAEKVICECKLKQNTDYASNVTFVQNKPDERFNKEIKLPNIVTIACGSVVSKSLKKNIGFFFTFFSLIIFFGFFLYRLIKGEKKLHNNLQEIKRYILGEKDNYSLKSSSEILNNDHDPNVNNEIKENNEYNDNKEFNTINSNNKNSLISNSNSKTRSIKNIHNEKKSSIISDDNKSKSTFNQNNINENNNANKTQIIETGNNNPIDIISNNNKSSIDININGIFNNNNNINNNNISGENIENSGIINNIVKESKYNPEELSNETGKINNNESKRSCNPNKNNSYSHDIDRPEKSYLSGIEQKTKENIENKEIKEKEENDLEAINIKISCNEADNKDINANIFTKSTIVNIESPFQEKNVKVDSMINKGDKKPNKNSDKPKANPPNKSKASTDKEFTKKNKHDYIADIINSDYSLDIMDYQDIIKGKKDERNIIKLWLSLIKNNSSLYFVFNKKNKYEDLFVKASLIILLLNIYLFFNTFLLYKMSMVKLYKGDFTFGNFILNIFITTLPKSIIAILIKKFLGITNFLQNISIFLEKNVISSTDQSQSQNSDRHKAHILSNMIVRYKRKEKLNILIYAAIGIVFLVFNCVLVSSFCGIYSNSVDELFLNTFMSLLLSNFFRAIFYLIGTVLRYYALRLNSETMYNISRFFNPLHLSSEIVINGFYGVCKKCRKCNCKKKNLDEGNLKDRPVESG